MADISQIGDSDCAVCLQRRNHPAQLPCGHIFCFLCLKGVAFRNRRCAMCRQEIPRDYLNNPILLESIDSNQQAEQSTTTLQWFYEGRNGWWKYDERSNVELEEKWSSGADGCQLLVAGTLYDIDFHSMVQFRHNDVSRRRKIKRDAPTVPSKGIAGIKCVTTTQVSTESNSSQDKSDTEENDITNDNNQNNDTNQLIDVLQALHLDTSVDSVDVHSDESHGDETNINNV